MLTILIAPFRNNPTYFLLT